MFTRLMKIAPLLVIGIFASQGILGQRINIIAGDTTGLTRHQRFDPPVHIERTGTGDPVEYSLDVNLDGINDILFKCDNSYGASGYASNYLTVVALDSNSVCYARVDSSYCINGYKPLYFTELFNVNDTIYELPEYTQNVTIIDKELWFMGDTCSLWVESTGLKYLAVRIHSNGMNGLAWVGMELFEKNSNGFSADIKETGFSSVINTVPDNSADEVAVFPNPSEGIVNIVIPGLQGVVTASLFNMLGMEIGSLRLREQRSTISLSQGTYLLKISRGAVVYKITKIVVL